MAILFNCMVVKHLLAKMAFETPVLNIDDFITNLSFFASVFVTLREYIFTIFACDGLEYCNLIGCRI